MKILKVIAATFCILMACWFTLSFVDIIADNCDPNPIHHSYNIFVLMGGK